MSNNVSHKFKKAAILIGVFAVASLIYPLLKSPRPADFSVAGNEIRLTDGVPVMNPALGQNFVVRMEYRDSGWNIYLYDFISKKETKINDVPVSVETVGPVVYQNHVYWVDRPAEGWIFYDYNAALYQRALSKIAKFDSPVYSLAVYENFLVFEAKNGDGTDVFLLNKNSAKIEPRNLTADEAFQGAPDIYGQYAVWPEFPIICDNDSPPAVSCRPSTDGNVVRYDLFSGQKEILKYNLPELGDVKIHNVAIAWEQEQDGRLAVNVYYMNTGVQVTVSPRDRDSFSPQLSGDMLLYYAQKSGGKDLEYYQFSTGKHGILSWTRAEKSSAVLGPSSRYIAWIDDRLGSEDLFYFDAQADSDQMDQDGDGLSDAEEFKIGSLAYKADTDDDGLTDYEEVKRYGTYPTQYDSDGDGLSDGEEILNWISDPKMFDSNADGVSDMASVVKGVNPMGDIKNLFAYGSPRLEDLNKEKNLAKVLRKNLDDVLGKGRWATKNNQEWFKVVNAYVYGGYNVNEIAAYVKGNRYALSETMLAGEWSYSQYAGTDGKLKASAIK